MTGVAGEGLASEGAVGRKRQAAMLTCGERDEVWAPRVIGLGRVPLAHHQMTELVVLASCSGKNGLVRYFYFCSCKDPKVVYFKWASPASKQHFLDWLVKVSR